MELAVDFTDKISILACLFSGLFGLRLDGFGRIIERLQKLFFFDDSDEAVYDLSVFDEEKCWNA